MGLLSMKDDNYFKIHEVNKKKLSLLIRDKIIDAMKDGSIMVEDLVESIPFKRKVAEILRRYI